MLSGKHRKILAALAGRPTPSNLRFADLEALLLALGAVVSEGSGSRVRFELSGMTFLAHRPHPGKEAKRYQVRALRMFLVRAGVIQD